MSFSSLMNNTMDVKSVVIASGTFGDESRTLTDKYTGVSCRIRQLNGSEVNNLERRGIISTHRVYCNATISVSAKDELVIKGKTYQVVGPPNNPHDMDHHLQIDVLLTE